MFPHPDPPNREARSGKASLHNPATLVYRLAQDCGGDHGRVCVVLLALALSGCGIAARMQAAEHAKELRAQSDAAATTCKSNFAADNPKTYLARQRCLNDAVNIVLPTLPNQDLVLAYMAERVAIGEQVQSGKMTVAQGDAAIADKASWMISEDQNRRNAATSVAAQVSGSGSGAAVGSGAAAGRLGLGNAGPQPADEAARHVHDHWHHDDVQLAWWPSAHRRGRRRQGGAICWLDFVFGRLVFVLRQFP